MESSASKVNVGHMPICSIGAYSIDTTPPGTPTRKNAMVPDYNYRHIVCSPNCSCPSGIRCSDASRLLDKDFALKKVIHWALDFSEEERQRFYRVMSYTSDLSDLNALEEVAKAMELGQFH